MALDRFLYFPYLKPGILNKQNKWLDPRRFVSRGLYSVLSHGTANTPNILLDKHVCSSYSHSTQIALTVRARLYLCKKGMTEINEAIIVNWYPCKGNLQIAVTFHKFCMHSSLSLYIYIAHFLSSCLQSISFF